VQFIGVALAPNLARNSSKQLLPDVPNGHCPSKFIDFEQNFHSPIHDNITQTSKFYFKLSTFIFIESMATRMKNFEKNKIKR